MKLTVTAALQIPEIRNVMTALAKIMAEGPTDDSIVVLHFGIKAMTEKHMAEIEMDYQSRLARAKKMRKTQGDASPIPAGGGAADAAGRADMILKAALAERRRCATWLASRASSLGDDAAAAMTAVAQELMEGKHESVV